VKDQLIELLKNMSSEADHLNLSKTDPADKPLSREEYKVLQKEKTKINHFKNKFFQPVKNRIVDIYGEEAASFMLSNRIMNEIITGKRESIAGYKLNLIEKYADELGLDPDQYLH
jgi:TRAP-type mannitol/chloroaromatic compound transport system substrate-binding protein